MKRGACEAGLEQRYRLTLPQAWPDLIEGMMTIENRQEQGLHPTPTRQDMGGVRRAEGIDERHHVELANYPEHQRHVGHGLDTWATGLICYIVTAMRHPCGKFSKRLHHSRCRREDRGRSPAGSKNPLTRPLPLEPGK